MVISGKKRTLGLLVLSQLGALMFVLKMALVAMPNIEPVSLLVMVYAVTLGKWALIPIYIYVMLEFLVWGVHLWAICYLYIWLVLWGLAILLRKMESRLSWAILCGTFGLFFGTMCAPVYLLSGGWAYALSWWVSGLMMDLVHCVGNFAMALVLFVPLRNLLTKLLIRSGLLPKPKPKAAPLPSSTE